MPRIKHAKCLGAKFRNDRLEMDIEATYDDDTTATFSFNVSHKKHIASSYKSNAGSPPTADDNTIVNMSEDEFKRAFEEYGRILSGRCAGKDSDTFDPSTDANRVLTRSIAFISDNTRMSDDTHCFPCFVDDHSTPKCITLTRQDFDDFKMVARFSNRASLSSNSGQQRMEVQPSAAANSWGRVGQLMKDLVGQENQLLSELDIASIEARLKTGAAGRAISRQLNKDYDHRAQQAIKKTTPDTSGRPAFRSGG